MFSHPHVVIENFSKMLNVLCMYGAFCCYYHISFWRERRKTEKQISVNVHRYDKYEGSWVFQLVNVKLHIFMGVSGTRFYNPASGLAEKRTWTERWLNRWWGKSHLIAVDPVTHGIRINVRVPFWVKLVQDNGSNVHLILFPAKRIANDSSTAIKNL